MTDLAARLREVIEERLEIARSAWVERPPQVAFGITGWARFYSQVCEPFDAILAGERDLGVLGRHRPRRFEGREAERFSDLPWCPICRGPAVPCAEIESLAKRYGIEVE